MYHAELGRFVSRDPLGTDAGYENLYGYAQGNPLRWTDPQGLQAKDPQQRKDAALIANCRKHYDEDLRRDRTFQKCWQAIVSRAKVLPEKLGEKCKALKFQCGCCYRIGVKDVLAFYSPKHHTIAICAEAPSVTGRKTAVVVRALCHEIIHALQSASCQPKPWERNCENDIMKEIEAYYCTGSCKTARVCTDKAVRSVKANPSSRCKQGEPTDELRGKIRDWADHHIRNRTMCQDIDPSLF